ncbi:MAG: methyltransferase domain-containing protein [Acidimicrobiia bacterium]
MSPGSIARRVLGERLFSIVGDAYRSVFVDFDRVRRHLPDFQDGATIVDIGGGDGAFLNVLLSGRPDIAVTIVDIAPNIGGSLESEFRDQVTLVPGTSLDEYAAERTDRPDWILISDVVHHIPVGERARFLESVANFIGDADCSIVVKEVQPSTPRARLAWFADRYVSGDQNVVFIPVDRMQQRLAVALPDFGCDHTGLLDEDGLNYSLVCSR